MNSVSLTQPGPARTLAGRKRPRGQVLVIFASAITLLLLMVAIVIDVSWLWSNALRVQRAADAAALAGAVTLPNDPGKGDRSGPRGGQEERLRPGRHDGRGAEPGSPEPAPDARPHHGAGPDVLHAARRLPDGDGEPAVGRGVQPPGSDGQPAELLRRRPVQRARRSRRPHGPAGPGNTGFERPNDTHHPERQQPGQPAGFADLGRAPTSRRERRERQPAVRASRTPTATLQIWRDFGLQGSSNIPTPGTTTNGNVTTTTPDPDHPGRGPAPRHPPHADQHPEREDELLRSRSRSSGAAAPCRRRRIG